MDRTFWHKQTSEPLFPDLLWSKPENKLSAGKLLIIGGNIHGFSAVSQAYAESIKNGVGCARIILPDVLQKTVSKMLPEAIFVPSTPSGSISQLALSEILDQASWADGVLIVGDLGRNSETAIMLEKFMAKYTGSLTLTKDALDYLSGFSYESIKHPETCLVANMAQLQHLAQSLKYTTAFKFDSDFLMLVDNLHNFTDKFGLKLIVKHLDNIFVAVSGQLSTTKISLDKKNNWQVSTAAKAAVWWLQNPAAPFEALTTAITQFDN